MELKGTFTEAFTVLRERPILFLPRLLTAVLASAFWLVLAGWIQDPFSVTATEVAIVSVLYMILIPIEVWVFNAYFLYMQDYHGDHIADFGQAFRTGFYKIPHGIGAFLLAAAVGVALSLPGTVILLAAYLAGDTTMMVVGGVFAFLGALVATAAMYFTPITAVIGSDGFIEEMKRGISTSRKAQHTVWALMLFSFGLLAVTFLAQGMLEQVGAAGFVIGRMLGGMLGVYVLLVNPEAYMDVSARDD